MNDFTCWDIYLNNEKIDFFICFDISLKSEDIKAKIINDYNFNEDIIVLSANIEQ